MPNLTPFEIALLILGAVLVASADMNDYNADDAYKQNYGCAPEEWRAKHLIIAHEVENIAITGLGTIDGNAEAFFFCSFLFE